MTQRDATATKDRILSAAFDEFTDCGFAGARVDRIAGRAEVNKSLLYQYFGDKEQLFEQVLHHKLTELGSVSMDPDQAVEAVGTFFDFHARNPWLTRLMLWEALEGGAGPVPNEGERRRQLRERVQALADAQAAGHVDADLEPRHTVVTLIGLVTTWFAFPQLARITCGCRDPYSPRALAARRAHVLDIAERILEAR